MIVRELIALFGFKVDRKQEQAVTGKLDKLKKVAGTLAAIFITGKIAQGINELVTSTAKLGDTIDKTSRKLGINSDALQELRFAGEQTGVAATQLDVGLQRFIRRSAEAANGTGEAKDALKELGVQLRDNNGNLRPAEELLGDVAEGLKNTENQSDKVRLAFKLFDTEGVNLVNTLGGGREELEKMRERARALGGVLDKDLIKLSAEYTDQQNEMSKALQGVRNVIAKILLPIWIQFVDIVRDFAIALRGPVFRAVKVIVELFRGLARSVKAIVDGWLLLNEAIVEIADSYLGLNRNLVQTLIVLGVLVAILGLPIVLLGLIGAAIFLVIDDLIAMGEGGKSIIGGLIAEFLRFVDELGGVGAAIREILVTAIMFWFDVSKETIDSFIENVIATFGGIWDDIVKLWFADVDEFFQFMFDRFKVIGDFVASLFGDDENVRRLERASRRLGPGASAGGGVGPVIEPGANSVSLTQGGTEFNMTINGGSGTPEQVGDVAAGKVLDAMKSERRRTFQQITTAGETP